jgi:heptosyltransferase-3
MKFDQIRINAIIDRGNIKSVILRMLNYLIATIARRLLCILTKKKGIRNFNVLVLRLDGIGDTIINTVFLKGLRQTFPGARITIGCWSGVKTFYKDCPWVNNIQTFDLQSGIYTLNMIKAIYFGFRIRKLDIDTVYLPRFSDDYQCASWIALACGAEYREGFNPTVKGELFDCNPLLSKRWTFGSVKNHEVVNLQLVLKQLGCNSISEKYDCWIFENKNTFKTMGIKKGEIVIALGIGARNKRRMWPIERYGEILNHINCKVIIVGNHEDCELGKQLSKYCNNHIINVCNVSIDQTIKYIKCCRLFIGNDSGPMHLAAFSGVEVIEISSHSEKGDKTHYNAPERFGPWGVKNHVIRPENPKAPCTDYCEKNKPHCILNITTDEVLRVLKHTGVCI